MPRRLEARGISTPKVCQSPWPTKQTPFSGMRHLRVSGLKGSGETRVTKFGAWFFVWYEIKMGQIIATSACGLVRESLPNPRKNSG